VEGRRELSGGKEGGREGKEGKEENAILMSKSLENREECPHKCPPSHPVTHTHAHEPTSRVHDAGTIESTTEEESLELRGFSHQWTMVGRERLRTAYSGFNT